ncbi:S16 family serine protease [Psychrobacillus sp. OK028]|uniref:S16 family serine protease n=1 Tax=Psychrobacillus sp. OK028 TaxID=1884359 RepID=UPI0020C87F5D|nr:S16 family serine protease [Psychrobacillus sp. OK028]
MKNRNLPFIWMVVAVIVIYSSLLAAYYTNHINGFVYIGVMLVAFAIMLIPLIIFRNDKKRIRSLSWISIILGVLLCFEAPLLWYESNTYIVSRHAEPIEAFDNSGVHLMLVTTFEIGYLEDKELIMEGLQQDNLDIIDLYKVTNKIRYQSKNSEILRWLKIQKDDFTIMKDNVTSYLVDETNSIEGVLNRNDISGDSVGLGLALSALIGEGTLENNLTFGVTGALNATGDVKAIGMIKEKVLIAAEHEYPYMIIPSENAKEASDVKTTHNLTLEILDVSHINQAISLIQELNEEHAK